LEGHDGPVVGCGNCLDQIVATEFDLLRYLMRNPGRVLSNALILERVWNFDFGGQSDVVGLYVSYLRKKIDAGGAPMIRTVHGLGYEPAHTPGP
jgi:two-component system, OmpR family, response regulator